MIFAGIDPGKDGAIAVLSTGGRMEGIKTPVINGKKKSYDLAGMVSIIDGIVASGEEMFFVIERQQAYPGQGGVSNFSTGHGFGLWIGILSAKKIPFQVVTPQGWKSSVLYGTSKDKAAAIAWVKARYPSVSLRATARSRIDNDGLADAICIAEYARNIYHQS